MTDYDKDSLISKAVYIINQDVMGFDTIIHTG